MLLLHRYFDSADTNVTEASAHLKRVQTAKLSDPVDQTSPPRLMCPRIPSLQLFRHIMSAVRRVCAEARHAVGTREMPGTGVRNALVSRHDVRQLKAAGRRWPAVPHSVDDELVGRDLCCLGAEPGRDGVTEQEDRRDKDDGHQRDQQSVFGYGDSVVGLQESTNPVHARPLLGGGELLASGAHSIEGTKTT